MHTITPEEAKAQLSLWAFAGTVASLAGGYVAFMVLGFVLGPGFDIDDKGAPIQKFFGAAALPALYASLKFQRESQS